eukprot:TRINITY_DN54999_c0_g1_i1.p1 TRINITY_DN54999_c0_g1~~TRINITY_DN54999_c0_g1_i1.p1  ORF type:complete len:849 (-),score=138.93 TRINITY_DN54999_c0_g1_i1:174-2720(-)
MNQLIPITNQIKDALAAVDMTFDVELPEICVVGGQSVGKSSLVESLVGHAFLPTGQGVVTRRPLVLRLCNTSNLGSDKEVAEFRHLPGRHFEDFSEVRKEIERETARICGDRQMVSPEPIVLKVSSPKVLDSTLIDLPGMTRLPVGDQPDDIEHQIRKLVLDFVRKPSCLILAVVAGNVDLATSDALSLARQVDPDGERTIGVVTKIDLVENGADVVSVLEGRVYPLRLGYVGVVCRSLRDVQNGKVLREHLHAEEQFFKNNPAFRNFSQRFGVSYLARQLNSILLDQILIALPDFKLKAMQMIQAHEAELQGYGESVSLQRGEQGALLLSLLTKFAARFGDAIEGKLPSPQEFSQGQLVGRARIDFIFRDVFSVTLRDFDCCSGLSDDEIRVAIRNATGPKATLFVPEAAFELLARKQILKLQAPSQQCAEMVNDELMRVLLLSELPEFKRFTVLRDHVFNVVRDSLHSCYEPTIQMIKDLISIELAYINTSHPDFVGSSSVMRVALTTRTPARTNERPVTENATGAQDRSGSPERVPPSGPESQASPGASGGGSGGGGSGGGFFSFFRGSQSGQSARATVAQNGYPAESGSVSARERSNIANEIDVDSGGPGEATDPSMRAGTANLQSDAVNGLPRGNVFPRTSGSESHATGDVVSGCDGSGRPIVSQRATDSAISFMPTGARRERRVSLTGNSNPFSTSAAGAGNSVTVSGAASFGNAGRPVDGSSALKLPHIPQVITPASATPSQRERVEVNIIKMLLESYLGLVKKNVADSVPKAIMHFMVNTLKDVIQSDCVSKLYKEERFEEVLREAQDVEGRRARCRERLVALHKVVELIEQVREGSNLF